MFQSNHLGNFMNKYKRSLISILLTGFFIVFATTSHAEEQSSYGADIGNKALNGFTNIITSWLEIPKNIINTTNDSNIFWGLSGGTAKGIINMAGRVGVGAADVITFPLPTKPIAQPEYIWDDFDVDTTYGDVFRLKDDTSPHDEY
jgi:putative exosortase-associated protein (TIGR04073 family)